MQVLDINTSIKSTVCVGNNILKDAISSRIKDKQIFVLTDSNVYRLYKNLIESLNPCSVYVLKAGEKSKNFNSLKKIITKMAESELNRNSYFIAFGGGVVGDIGGLCASTYMRGIRLIQVPTTLLSQVDSSVGGKTAVDFNGVKNLFGTFYPAELVICDGMFLKTLNKAQIKCGLGEILKTSALDKDIFELITSNKNKLFDLQFLTSIVFECVKFKASIVERDEKETTGLRSILNLGHTTGHALELFYKNRSHGEYVLFGMYYEIEIALKKGLINENYAEELKNLILKVIKKMPDFENIELAGSKAILDKKNDKINQITMIISCDKGQTIPLKLETEDYINYLKDIRRNILESIK